VFIFRRFESISFYYIFKNLQKAEKSLKKYFKKRKNIRQYKKTLQKNLKIWNSTLTFLLHSLNVKCYCQTIAKKFFITFLRDQQFQKNYVNKKQQFIQQFIQEQLYCEIYSTHKYG